MKNNMFKRSLSILLILCLVFGASTVGALAAPLPFTDVPSGSWFYGAVGFVYEAGIMTGATATTFAPNATLTRAQLVTILWRMEGAPNVPFEPFFEDVPEGQWFSEAILWAFDNEIVTGTGPDTFAPDANITREQFATIMHRYADFAEQDLSVPAGFTLNQFADRGNVSAWAYNAMRWAVYTQLMSGTASTTLSPGGSATRAQAATILTRFILGPDEETGPGGSGIHGAIHRVEYNGNVVYVFGSLHGGRPEWFPLADVVEDAMRRADMFATEIDLQDGAALEEALFNVIILPDRQTWADFLPQAAYDHMVAVLPSWGIIYEEVNIVNPYFLIHDLYMVLAADMTEDIDIGIDVSVDAYVLNTARKRERPVFGLESIEQQINIVFNPPLEVMVERILYGFVSPEEAREAIMNSDELTLDELAYYYQTNNLAALNAAFAASTPVGTGSLVIDYMREVVLNYRSTYYANVIADFLRDTDELTTLFVVVGLSHVIRSGAGAGFTDIIQQLTLAGFEPVPLF